MKIPARRGAATHLRKGQKVKIINTHGSQVVDFWAFNANNPGEFMSMEHCRVWLGRYRPKPGDALITNQRRNILKFLEDTSPGVHDTMMAACDRFRYEQLGCHEYHDNCTDNLWEALAAVRFKPTETPCPFNLWQNTPVDSTGGIEQLRTVSERGDFVLFKALMDTVLCFSACPQDIVQINSGRPKNAHYKIID
ncbi:MAG TPA: urea carboxylase-associated family protein [Gammaproteobacteria bacterium]|nr:urea carboxylase-associated family protein [Gammaproteobacteria bacterium]